MFRILLLGIFLCVIAVTNSAKADYYDYYVSPEVRIEQQENLYKQYRYKERNSNGQYNKDHSYSYPLYFN